MMIKLVFVACSLLSPPGPKQPCKEVAMTMIATQAYGLAAAPIVTDAEHLSAVSCQRNGTFEIAKWAVVNTEFSVKRGFKCVPEHEMAKIDT